MKGDTYVTHGIAALATVWRLYEWRFTDLAPAGRDLSADWWPSAAASELRGEALGGHLPESFAPIQEGGAENRTSAAFRLHADALHARNLARIAPSSLTGRSTALTIELSEAHDLTAERVDRPTTEFSP
jgi:hypothetical protein